MEVSDFNSLVAEARNLIEAAAAEPESPERLLDAGNASTIVLIHPHFPKGDHWFCDPGWMPLARKALLTTSNAGSDAPAFVSYIEGLGRQLNRCGNCARIYHEQFEDFRAELRDVLGVAPEKLEHLAHVNYVRDECRMVAAFNQLESATGSSVHSQQQAANILLVEALYTPQFIDDPNHTLLLKRLITLVDHGEYGRATALADSANLAPGLVQLLYHSDSDLHKWAKATLASGMQRGVDGKLYYKGRLSRLTLNRISMIVQNAASIPQKDEYVVAFWFNSEVLFTAFSAETYKEQLLQQDDHILNALRRQVFGIKPSNAAALQPMTGIFDYWISTLGVSELQKFFYPSSLRDVVGAFLDHPSSVQALSYTHQVLPDYDPAYQFRGVHTHQWIETLFAQMDQISDKKEAQSLCVHIAKTTLAWSNWLKRSATTAAGVGQGDNSRLNDVTSLEILAVKVLRHALYYKLPLSPPLIEAVEEHIRHDAQALVVKEFKTLVPLFTNSSNKEAITLIPQLFGDSIKLTVASAVQTGLMAFENSNSPDKTVSRPSAQIATASATNVPRPSMDLWNDLNMLPRKMRMDPQLCALIFNSGQHTAFLHFLEVRRGKQQSETAANSAVAPTVTNLKNTLQFVNEMDEPFIRSLLKSAAASIFLFCFSGDDDISQLATGILCQCFDETGTRQDALRKMLQWNAKLTLQSITWAIDVARNMQLFSVCPNVIRVGTDVLQCLYGTREGVIDDDIKETFSSGADNELLLYWRANWKFLKFTFQNTKPWGSLYVSGIMREFLKAEAYFTQGLLDNFRLFEADLPSTVSATLTKGEILAKDATDTIESMCDVLRLKDEELLVPCLKNIMTMIELMNSFKISLPESLKSVFMKYAAQEIRNNMTRQNTEALLSAIGTPEDEIDRILDIANRGPSASVSPAPTPTPSSTSVRSKPVIDSSRPSAQQTLNKFFAPADRAPELSLPAHYKGVVEPSAPSRTSQIDMVRQSLVHARSGTASARAMHAAASKPIPKEIHPARPAGFNPRKPVRPSASVATGDDPQDDSDSEDEGLFEKEKAAEKRPVRNILKDNRSTPVLQPIPRAPSISDKEKEQQRMRQRLNINLNPLYKTVLSWDYHSESAYPDAKRDYAAVKDAFGSVTEYQQVLEPLLMLECWQGIQRAKAEGASKNTPFKVTIGKRVSVDSFTDIYASVLKSAAVAANLTDSDLIVLTYYPGRAETAKHPSSSQPYCMAKIKEISSANPEYFDLVLRTYEPLKMLPFLGQKFESHGFRISSMITIEREYSALKGLPFYDLENAVILGQPNFPIEFGQSKVDLTMSTYGVNESQARAVLQAAQGTTRGFSLIQGPPGTGKTKTILAIIGSYLTSIQAVTTGISPQNRPSHVKRRILVCAPSNAAVDELVLRLKAGILSSKGTIMVPQIVRLGRSDAIHSQVKDVTLEELVDKAIEKIAAPIDDTLRQKQTDTVAQRDKLRQKLSDRSAELTAKEVNDCEQQVRDLTQKIKSLGRQLDAQREQLNTVNRRREIERRECQSKILNEAEIICATLSGSAHNVLLSLQLTFDTVIIDEAAQAVELSTLIPLKYGCKRCIMVGDPKQLPPTVLSQEAAALKYEQSLFVRIFKRHEEKFNMLNTQFRMHPDISRFPSKEFYDSRLLTPPEMAAKTERPWHNTAALSPYRFFNIEGRHETSKETKSLFNRREASFALELYEYLTKQYPGIDFTGKVGIISPYKRQVQTIVSVFTRKYGQTITNEIDFNTVDGFQGQEKDIIILSCVRSVPDDNNGLPSKGVGFLGDTRRMNVALTRAKSSMWILGHADSLTRNVVWSRLFTDAQSRGLVANVQPGSLSRIRNGDTTTAIAGNFKSPYPVKESAKMSLEASRPIDTSSRALPSPAIAQDASSSDTSMDTANNSKIQESEMGLESMSATQLEAKSRSSGMSDSDSSGRERATKGIVDSVPLKRKRNTVPGHTLSDGTSNPETLSLDNISKAQLKQGQEIVGDTNSNTSLPSLKVDLEIARYQPSDPRKALMYSPNPTPSPPPPLPSSPPPPTSPLPASPASQLSNPTLSALNLPDDSIVAADSGVPAVPFQRNGGPSRTKSKPKSDNPLLPSKRPRQSNMNVSPSSTYVPASSSVLKETLDERDASHRSNTRPSHPREIRSSSEISLSRSTSPPPRLQPARYRDSYRNDSDSRSDYRRSSSHYRDDYGDRWNGDHDHVEKDHLDYEYRSSSSGDSRLSFGGHRGGSRGRQNNGRGGYRGRQMPPT